MPDIPSISDYSHHNEEAAARWYAENRYDMMYGDEPDSDPYDDYEYDYTDPEAAIGREDDEVVYAEENEEGNY